MLHRLILRSSFRRYVTWYHNWARLLLMGNFSSQPLKIVSAALSTCFLFCIILILLPPSGVIPLTGLVVLNAREVLLMNIILNCCEFPPWSLFFQLLQFYVQIDYRQSLFQKHLTFCMNNQYVFRAVKSEFEKYNKIM